MNSNLKMTVERSKRRSYFLSLVFITKSLFHRIFFWRVKNLIVAMLVHLNEEQRSCTCFKKGLRRNLYCLSRYQVSLRDICLERYWEWTFRHEKINSLSKKSCFVVNKNTHQRHAFWCSERWKSHFRASRFNFFFSGGMPLDPWGKVSPPLVVTTTY